MKQQTWLLLHLEIVTHLQHWEMPSIFGDTALTMPSEFQGAANKTAAWKTTGI